MTQTFFISDLGEDRAILGYPFLYDFNPKPDWKKGKLPDSTGVIVHNDSKKNIRAELELLHLQKDAIRVVGQPKDGEAIFMRRMTFATMWALKSQDKPTEGPVIPKQYQRYADVFSEELAKRFPPSRDENMNIKFIPGAPTNLDCKIYPLNAEE